LIFTNNKKPIYEPMNKIKILIISILPCLVLLATSSTPGPDYDTLIKNGKVIDGAGNPWFYADIGIKDGEIKSMGNLKQKSAKYSAD